MSNNGTEGRRKIIIVKDIRASNLKFRHIFRYSVAIQLGTYLVRTPRVTATDDKTARWTTSLELIIDKSCGLMELWVERSTPFKRGFRIAKTSVKIDMKELLPQLSYEEPLTREFKFASAELVISFLIKDEEADGDDFAMVSFSKYTVDDFEVLGLIGRGAFGEVLRVKVISTGKIFAMKIVRKADLNDQLSVSAIQAERDIMLGVQHPFICRLHAAMGTPHHLCFVLDLLPGKDLAFHMRKTSPLSPNRAQLYAGCVALALNHLHGHGFIYRDLKSENIVLDSKGFACLTDFGMAKGGLAGSLRTYTTCGTPEYISPEILLGKAYAKEVDWWALGVLIYEMLVGNTPFYCTSANAVYQRIVKEDVKFPENFDPSAKELIEQLLIKDQKQRLADGNQIMALRYFNGLNFNALLNKTLTPEYVPEPEEEPPPSTIGFLVLSEYLKQQRSPKNRYLADQLEGFSFYPVEVSS